MTVISPVYPLTPRQQQFLAAIERLTATRGFPPTLRELAAELGVHESRSLQLARNLVRRGHVARDYRVPRSIRVVKTAMES
jgi:SOS-response transcriptional repressor LexA